MFVTSVRNRHNSLIKEDAIDNLADDLETEMDAPNEPLSAEEADLEQSLSEDNPQVADSQ